ncbi:type IV-A pilus assembly ATPase PilB [Pokkaliibacter sp. CJK22405]|uniref:type IV-A pilus assembly ATPase PilB n=1 Tax=Pokkaliibacter sp. CJK22405 TaxID=3384615 RepID=UPI0039847419
MMGVPFQPVGLVGQLVKAGLITDVQAKEAAKGANQNQQPLPLYLVEKLGVDERALAEVISKSFSVPVLDLSVMDSEVWPKDVVKDKIIQKHFGLPLLVRGKKLFVGFCDPTQAQAVSEFKFSSNMSVEPVLVEAGKLAKAIEHLYDEASDALDGFDDSQLEKLETTAEEQPQLNMLDLTAMTSDDAPVVKFVNKILLDAIKRGSSDIHFEPYEKIYRVRCRTDGVLHEVSRPPATLGNRIAARLKVMSHLDISERRMPQDGRIKMKISRTRAIDFRVNTLPTLWGEKVVLRILDPSSAQMGIDALGYEPEQKEMYLDALEQPQGMILVTGPTGSGKTVSLYTGLNILNTSERNISTAEDPVEINIEGINQVHINPKVGLNFAEALRSFLRQDPDVVMVGEIRDLETAEIAIKAAQTGHLVLSTLHTNSAPETLARLQNMGVPVYNVATSVSLIIAQRLARRLCNSCKQVHDVPEEVLREAGFNANDISNAVIYKPVGCTRCHQGYKGRVGIYEVLKVSEPIQEVIMKNGSALDISRVAQKEGMLNLRQSGIRKVLHGMTSLEELNRVIKE